MVLTGFENALAQGGMNEKGLFFDWFTHTDSKALTPADPDKLTYKGSLSEKILAECATVTEALEYFEKYNEPGLGYATILLADSSGDSATVSWIWWENIIKITRTAANYQVIGTREAIVELDFSKNADDILLSRYTDLLEKAGQPDFTVYSSVFTVSTILFISSSVFYQFLKNLYFMI